MQDYFSSNDGFFKLYKGDSRKILKKFNHKFDLVFADPPYFLSGGGDTIQSGKVVKVDKGKWDKPTTRRIMSNFNYKWLSEVREVMNENASIFISGSFHNIFNIAEQLTRLDFKILNAITWEKSNPPPHLARRYFTHSTEQIIWARKHEKKAHYFNYELMKEINGGRQMKDVWKLPAIAPWEKKFGKHPTQKPLSVLVRIILATTRPGDLILDPFTGSSTTGIAASLLGRKFVGIDTLNKYLNLSVARFNDLNSEGRREEFIKKIRGFDYDLKLKNIIKEQVK